MSALHSENSVQVKALQGEVHALKAIVQQIQSSVTSFSQTLEATNQGADVQLSQASPSHSTRPVGSYAAAVSPNVNRTSSRNATNLRGASKSTARDRKFNIVMYGIGECENGTRRHARITSDVKSVTTTIQSICPEITEQSVCDCIRLGKYNSESSRARPILVQLTRSCDVVNILSNRNKLPSSSYISIKPHMSKFERTTELTLLRQRRSLVEQGTDKKSIKIWGNSLYVNKSRYGVANDSVFTLCEVRTPGNDPPNDDPDV